VVRSLRNLRRIKKLNSTIQNQNRDKIQEEKGNDQLSGFLQEDFLQVRKYFEGASDFRYRELEISSTYSAMIFYLDGLVGIERIELNVITPLVKNNDAFLNNPKPTIGTIVEELSSAQVKQGETIQEVINHILLGDTVLLINGFMRRLY
jgi:spore germination protein